jgi:hypothetical protein
MFSGESSARVAMVDDPPQSRVLSAAPFDSVAVVAATVAIKPPRREVCARVGNCWLGHPFFALRCRYNLLSLNYSNRRALVGSALDAFLAGR